MRIIKLIVLLLLASNLNIVKTQATASETNLGFVYTIYRDNQPVKVVLSPLDRPTESVIDVPTFGFYALSPTQPMLAYSDAQGLVHIINLMTHEASSIGIVSIHNIDLVYGSHQQNSGSLHWSPDGRYLAFVGHQAEEDATNIYVYSVETENVTLTSPEITIVDQLVDITSWSPDSQWLTIIGRWTTDNNVSVALRSAVLARDGSSWMELGHEQRSCSVEWSPDQTRLVTDTGCFEGLDSNTALLIFSFDPSNPATNQREPLEVRETSPKKFARLDFPNWLDSDTLIFARFFGPRGGNLSPDDFMSEMVTYQVSSNAISVVPNSQTPSSWEFQYENHLFSWNLSESGNVPHLEAFNLIDQEFLQPIRRSGLCPTFYTRITSDGQFVALYRGCTPNANPAIEIINTHTDETVFEVSATENAIVYPLGFVKLN